MTADVPHHPWYFPVKRTVDILVALSILVLTGPLLLLSALVVKLTSRGPAFYSQRRLGRGGREFTLWKLRTMVDGAERHTGPVWAVQNDPRITPVGRFLRNAHIDELPQMVNILLGHMSLVGPRPERPEIARRLGAKLEDYWLRLLVRPGLTGIAQLRLPPEGDLRGVRKKLRYDLFYVRRLNPLLDAQIIWLTVLRVTRDFPRAVWRSVVGAGPRGRCPEPAVGEPAAAGGPRSGTPLNQPVPAIFASDQECYEDPQPADK